VAVTVLEAIQRSTEFLTRKGVDSPRLQTELLLADLLELPRMQLYLNFDRALNVEQVQALRERIRRRGQREPLQYILGSTSFCGWEIAVNPHVLVPRPETELLAEHAWQFLNGLPSSLVTHPSILDGQASNLEPRASSIEHQASNIQPRASSNEHRPSTVLDFGTGSGCLAVAVALKCPSARVQALDVSPEALELARQNALRHQVADRIEFLLGDGFSVVPKESRFDLIVSNPPYIPSGELSTLQPEVREHEPRRALDGGPDGLAYFRRLASEAGPFLQRDARLMVEFGDGQEAAVAELFRVENWVVEAIREDYTHRPRIMVARRQ
jgi:release factor glutamine methyltransferase